MTSSFYGGRKQLATEAVPLTTALPSVPTYPALPPPRATALRPVSAGESGARNTGSSDRPHIEAEELREDELHRLRPEGAESHTASADAGHERSHVSSNEEIPTAEARAETPSFPGGTTAFLTQLLAQKEPGEEQPDPYGDASRAYERFLEERDTGHVIDIRDPVDVNI